ncbi:MAG: CoA-binding protein [Candidatus Pacebacteria bacterium]|nr:CoA-binding protein [Candidatus Paceibacterota bacterium]
MNLDNIFNAQNIAIIGASEEPKTVGAGLVKNLFNSGKNIYCVNPFQDKIFGIKTFDKISNISEKIDLAIIAVPAKIVLEIVEDCVKKKVKGIIIISSGFGETGEQGKELEQRIKEVADKAKIPLIGPNCLGIINLNKGLNASFAPIQPQKGNIALLSQSGALIDALIDKNTKDDLGFSKIISYGNEAQVDLSQMLLYLKKDKDTNVILLYLEGVKNGKEFFSVAKEVAKEKPIVVLKSGKSKSGEKAISTHTGSLAGEYEVYRAVFKQTGLIEVDSIEEFLDIGKALAFQKRFKNGIGIITNGGGLGVLAADYCEKLGVEIKELNKETIEKLDKDLEKVSIKRNPLDVLGDASPERYEVAIRNLLEQKDINALVVIQAMQIMTEAEKNAKIIVELKNKFPSKTIICCFVGNVLIEKAVNYLEDNKIPNYSDPKRAIRVIKSLII